VPKKPRYSLESYLEHIRSKKEDALRVLGEAEEKLRVEREKHDRLKSEYDALSTERDRRREEYWKGLREGKLSPPEIQGRKNHLEGIESDAREKRMEMLAQDRAIRRAEKGVEEARLSFQEVSNEEKIHEEKKERWLKELKKEEEKKLQREMEDISGATHERRRRERERGR